MIIYRFLRIIPDFVLVDRRGPTRSVPRHQW